MKPERTRKIPVQIYLDEDEFIILTAKCAETGKSKSALIRQLIIYGYVYEVDYSIFQKNNATLGRIAGSLNQITKRINETGNIYKEDMNEIKEMMKEIWQLQKSILSRVPLENPSNTSPTRTRPTDRF